MRVTAPVLCGAYPRGHKGEFLTHRAEVGVYDPAVPGSGWPVALCKRVARTGSITDDSTQHTQDRPTCPVCARIFDREVK